MKSFVETMMREAGQIALDHFHNGVTISTKAHRVDFVTEADVAVSDYMVAAIERAHQDHGIITEELDTPIRPEAPYQWVIDPIDGTFNFAIGVSVWCILATLLYNDEPILAAAYDPIADQLYVAEKGKGTELNGEPVCVNDHASLDRTMGFVHISPDKPTCSRYTDVVAGLTEAGARMLNHRTRFLACKVASGEVDFAVSNWGSEHDNLAPYLIAKEAGALATAGDGGDWYRDTPELIIANPALHKEILELLK